MTSRLVPWLVAAIAIVTASGMLSLSCYNKGRDDERGKQRVALIKHEQRVIDSIDRARALAGTAAALSVAASERGAAALPSLDRRVSASRRAVVVVDTLHVVVHDTLQGTSRVASVPPEVVARIVSDSIVIDSLRNQTKRDAATIFTLRAQLSIDTIAFARRDSLIRKLSMPVAPPPLLDRAIARVTVPVVKGALVAAAAYGAYRLAKSRTAKHLSGR